MSEKPNNSEEKILKPKKRKVGRPKKRGPKKKRKSRAKKKPDKRRLPKPANRTEFKIVSCHNGKQDGYVGRYKTAEEAYEDLERLKEQSSSVMFPKIIENRRDGIGECKYEYLLLEKNRYGDKEDARIQNEYGMFVRQETNSDKWVVYDKVRYNVEETFWIYGMSPRNDRKTFQWISDNMILTGFDDTNRFKRISIYKNKVLLRDDNGGLEMVLCKTQGEAVRFYNKVNEMCSEDPRIIMCGSEESTRTRARSAENDIMELTGWSLYKVQMRTTRK